MQCDRSAPALALSSPEHDLSRSKTVVRNCTVPRVHLSFSMRAILSE